MKILVGGSNKGNNSLIKEKAIDTLRAAGHKVKHTRDIFRSFANKDDGNRAILSELAKSDIYYIINFESENDYIGNATIAKLSLAYSIPTVSVFSSHPVTDPDLEFYIDAVVEPRELAKHLQEQPKYSMHSKKDKAIYSYVFHLIKYDALSENISLTLQAERMPEGELYAWLDGKGYLWKEEYDNWLYSDRSHTRLRPSNF